MGSRGIGVMVIVREVGVVDDFDSTVEFLPWDMVVAFGKRAAVQDLVKGNGSN